MLKRNTKSSGFTLIELLIVIVIIGVLSGVLISIINIRRQKEHAMTATITSSMNKVALGNNGFISAYGRIPDEAQFISSLQNVIEVDGTCSTPGEHDCIFAVQGVVLPATCDSSKWNGVGTDQCNFRYVGTEDLKDYKLVAKKYGSSSTTLVFNSSTASIADCEGDNQECSGGSNDDDDNSANSGNGGGSNASNTSAGSTSGGGSNTGSGSESGSGTTSGGSTAGSGSGTTSGGSTAGSGSGTTSGSGSGTSGALACASSGQMCGGIAGKVCCTGLACDMGGRNTMPDASGTCVAEVVKGQSCASTGQMCGGIAGITCCSGLSCNMGSGKPTNTPDASGTCATTVIKKF